MSRAREVGDLGSVVTVDDGNLIINESGADVDFRVEGDTNANLLFVDASADAVLLGTNSSATLSGYTMVGQFKNSIGILNGSADEFSGALLRQSSTSNSITLTADPADLRANSFLGFDVDGAERARFTSDGYLRMASGSGGIQFNGDTAAANALDDYEEGTWTPSIEGASVAGTTTYRANRLGWYRKIGSQVTVWYYVQISATTGTGFMELSGLPFNTASSGIQSAGSVMTDDLNWSGSSPSLTSYADGSRNYLLFFLSGDNVGWTPQQMTNEIFELIGTHTYFV